jgi:hypothetical protein
MSSEVQILENIVSWSGQSEFERDGRKELKELLHGRSMQYASVENPRSFCADMKSSTGRLMDFNKGMT